MAETDLNIKALNYNINRIRLINKIYLTIFVSIVIIIYTLETLSTISFTVWFSEGWWQYSILLIASAFYVYLLDFRKIIATRENCKRTKYIVYLFLTIFLNLPILLLDGFINPLFLYPLLLFSSIPFLILKMKGILINSTISSLLLLISQGIEIEDAAILGFQAVYILTLSIIAFLITSTSYSSSQKLQTESLQEIQQLRTLTKLLKEANYQLGQEATLDPLTNLYNRRAYNDYLINLQQRIIETPQSISVIMVDVDCFKLFNDTYGHSEGDYVLSKIGRLLHDISNEYKCFAARWGGEEFVLILPSVSDEIVERICYQIKERVYDLNIEHESSTINSVVTVSIGACSKYITELNEIYNCISEADAALYSVKENGRNNFEHRYQIHA